MSSMKATVVGLGAMGMGIATSALKAGLDVTGCDVSSDALNAFMAAGGKTVTSPSEAAADADLLAVVAKIFPDIPDAFVAMSVKSPGDDVSIHILVFDFEDGF